MGRIDDEETRGPERFLAMRAGLSRPYVQFEPQDVGRAERRDRIQDMGVGPGIADRPPRDIGSARPFAERAHERLLDALRFTRLFERRVDQNDAPPLLWRNIGVERNEAVRADDAEARVAAERRHQLLALFRVSLAKRDAVLRPEERLRDRRRSRVGERRAARVAPDRPP